LTRHRANALEPDRHRSETEPADIATDEIHVESAFGAKPIRVLTYRPVTTDDPLPVIVHIQQWPQRERIAQFGVDKFDCAHGWQPRPFVAKQNDKEVTAWRQVRVDKRSSCCGLVVTSVRKDSMSLGGASAHFTIAFRRDFERGF
jgi:hypothetical protein